MAKSKKVVEQLEGNTESTITVQPRHKVAEEQVPISQESLEANSKPITDAEFEQIKEELKKRPASTTIVSSQPLFTADNTEQYRNLLLERPGVPTVTNIHEAIAFVGLYEKWNNKVRVAFR